MQLLLFELNSAVVGVLFDDKHYAQSAELDFLCTSFWCLWFLVLDNCSTSCRQLSAVWTCLDIPLSLHVNESIERREQAELNPFFEFGRTNSFTLSRFNRSQMKTQLPDLGKLPSSRRNLSWSWCLESRAKRTGALRAGHSLAWAPRTSLSAGVGAITDQYISSARKHLLQQGKVYRHRSMWVFVSFALLSR